MVAALPVGVSLVSNKTNFIQRAYLTVAGRNADLQIDLADKSSFSPSWNYLAQGGEEKEKMLDAVVEPVNALNPKYIRIDHLFDFYNPVSRGPGGQLEFNWTKVDAELAKISQAGAIPFISLSYMPSVISSGSEIDPPRSWDEWGMVVRRTVEHVSGRTGLAINNVYYEVWNEPDLFGGYKLGGERDYLKMYVYAERGAKSASNILPFKIGGPGTTKLYKNWMVKFLKYTADTDTRVDFYSWHNYDKDIYEFESDFEDAKEWIAEIPGYQNMEFVISEAGPNSGYDEWHDNNMGAIHTIALQSALAGKISKVFTFEIKDGPGPQKYWGRWGILTHEKYGPPEKKPRYNALLFLNQMNSIQKLGITGQGTWVKSFAVVSTSPNTFRIMLVNYDIFGSHSEAVPLRFTNLPYNRFRYKRINFGGGQFQRDQITEGNTYQTIERMAPNSAAIIEVAPI